MWWPLDKTLGDVDVRWVAAHGACFFNAIQQPPPLWVVWVGSLASGSVFGVGRGAHRVVMSFLVSVPEDLGERPVV
jgi:hypothetical protein